MTRLTSTSNVARFPDWPRLMPAPMAMPLSLPPCSLGRSGSVPFGRDQALAATYTRMYQRPRKGIDSHGS